MGVFREALGGIAGGRVLDVATGRGGFVSFLMERLESYSGVIGIDSYERAIVAAQRAYGAKGARMIQMDGGRLAFRDGCFDTVGAGYSIHHWTDVPQVLGEMKRVLRPGGYLIVSEMHQDAETDAQRTDVDLHQWAAAVDRQLGFAHNPTLSRQELVGLLERLGLRDLARYDRSDTTSDPTDAGRIREREGLIERCLERARQTPDYEMHRRHAEALRRRLHEIGSQSEPVVLIIGRKA
jgi:SAM-dependent methyltransferase